MPRASKSLPLDESTRCNGWALRLGKVTVHRLGTGSFFGPLWAEKGACPLRPGGQSRFRGLRCENRDSPRERLLGKKQEVTRQLRGRTAPVSPL